MAKVSQTKALSHDGRGREWTSAEWFDGRVWELDAADFGDRDIHNVRMCLRYRAHCMGMRVTVRQRGDGIVILQARKWDK